MSSTKKSDTTAGVVVMEIPRPEYPWPDRRREEWLNLNGTWSFRFDPREEGETGGWQGTGEWSDSRSITVPFCWQSEASGVGDAGMQERAWYRRTFSVPDGWTGRRVILNFGAVDHDAKVWVNGSLAGMHSGGYTPFAFDITPFLSGGENVLTVCVTDRFDLSQLRGKQYWKETPDRCWYTAVSGIWQTVWLEPLGEISLERFYLTPDIDRRLLEGEFELDRYSDGLSLELQASWHGSPVFHTSSAVLSRRFRIILPVTEPDSVDEIHYWTPERPELYDLTLTLKWGEKVIDRISTYFAMRKFEISGDEVWLNNRPIRQRLVLDQGYWKETLLTPPSEQALIDDIRWTKELGFNGARKHQKIEDPLYYYWADRMGLLVWGELPSGYDFGRVEIEYAAVQWMEFLKRDYNHPCIVTWVPFNESWGIRNVAVDARQQATVRALVELAKAFDGTRPVSGNDGWEWVESDILGIHDYVARGVRLKEKLLSFEEQLQGAFNGGRRTLAVGRVHEGQPVMLTEFGGIAFAGGAPGWGYASPVETEEEFLLRLDGLLAALRESPVVKGWCYTQLTDVFQEVNGLLTIDRTPKAAPEVLAERFSKS